MRNQLNNIRKNSHLQSGLAYTAKYKAPNTQEQQERNMGKMVLKDFCGTPEVLEIISIKTQENSHKLIITLRSVRHKQHLIQINNLNEVRQANQSEVMAGSRRGSDAYESHWNKQRQNQNWY